MDSDRRKGLSVPMLLALVVAYLVIIQGGGRILASGVGNGTDSAFPSVELVIRQLVIPIGLSVLLGVAVATRLGWWQEILHERKPVQAWVGLVPISMIIFALVGTAYGHLFEQSAGLVLSFVLLVILIGLGEELMFRGIAIVALRRRGLSEARVAIFSSLLFGLVHLSNALDTGSTAIAQAAVVSFAGYFLYLSRRVGGGLWLAVCVHAAWDFSLLSSQIGPDPVAYPLQGILVMLLIFLVVRVIRRRHQIDLVWRQGAPPEPSAA